jgi:type IV secretory pathway TraG/TraD family ATPase VirD4
VLRYLALALNSVATADGRALCTPTPDDPDGFDMTDIIEGGGTVYLLADPNRIDRARPLLSLFAAEMFMAAETVALHQPGQRLPVPFIAVLDELRYGVTVPNLPYVASSQRKYGIGFVYSVQSSSQEEAVYGKDAAALRDAAGITIVGGIDINLAKELSDRAGTTTVVTAARGTSSRSEHTERQDTLTVADQQNLADGHAVVLARGLPPFIGHAPSLYDQRRRHGRIRREETQVTSGMAAAKAVDRSLDRGRPDARKAGFRTTVGRDMP